MIRKSNYSVSETIYNAYRLLITKIFFSRSRLIRSPITIRGKKYIDFGKNLTTGRNCQLEVNGNHEKKCLIFGNNVNIGNNVRFQCANSIITGDDVLIGSRVTIIDNSHGTYSGNHQDNPNTPPNKRILKTSPIKIGNRVWIGDGTVIQQGVTIGNGSIIAANTIVTKDIPENVIAGGQPARILKKYDEKKKEWIKVKENK